MLAGLRQAGPVKAGAFEVKLALPGRVMNGD